MRVKPSGQLSESKKVRIRKQPVAVNALCECRKPGPRQAGMLWQRKMHTLALRRPKGRVRRDRSGAPMKRG